MSGKSSALVMETAGGRDAQRRRANQTPSTKAANSERSGASTVAFRSRSASSSGLPEVRLLPRPRRFPRRILKAALIFRQPGGLLHRRGFAVIHAVLLRLL
jgi:hypothetical protein